MLRRVAILLALAVLAVVAVRGLPEAFAYTKATVRVAGTAQSGGTPFLTCTGLSSSISLRPKGNQTDSGTYTIECSNALDYAVSVSLINRTMTPTVVTQPSASWDRLTFTVPSRSSARATVTVSANRYTTQGVYTYSFTANVVGADAEMKMDFSRPMNFSITVN